MYSTQLFLQERLRNIDPNVNRRLQLQKLRGSRLYTFFKFDHLNIVRIEMNLLLRLLLYLLVDTGYAVDDFPPRHPQFSEYQARINTFGKWPSYIKQTPRALAKAGLFYTG